MHKDMLKRTRYSSAARFRKTNFVEHPAPNDNAHPDAVWTQQLSAPPINEFQDFI
jgi:hypothetical protein